MNANAKDWLKRLQPLIALAVMIVALSLMSDRFLTLLNGRNILLQISVNLCISIGMTLVILTGGIDLSVGAILAFAGAFLGLLGSLVVSHLMARLLYGVSPNDPVTFVGVTLVLTAVALAACYIPARRAMRVDPIVALRNE